MSTVWDKLDKEKTPTLEMITASVNMPLWKEIIRHMQSIYETRPLIEYSGCGMMPGWNVKFKKAGKALCTLYPDKYAFSALVVIGQKEKVEIELALPTFTAYTQELYKTTKEGMGQRWLMFEVGDEAVLEDVKQCIAIRRRIK